MEFLEFQIERLCRLLIDCGLFATSGLDRAAERNAGLTTFSAGHSGSHPCYVYQT